ncbi:hypothetical protein G9A89_011264 [Geosiphon pyriformis]|nr:hypothetical protein G9A89_011264 [Geosiphon pyriformis]
MKLNPFVVKPTATISGPSAKKRSARVLTAGLVGDNSTQKVKKPLSDVKLLSVDKNLKNGGPVSVDRQLTSMDMDGEAFDGKTTSDSQMNMPNAKHFNTDAAIGSPFGSINYDMDDEKEVWVDSKIIKTQVEVAVKKSFTLDINLLAVEEKSVTTKEIINVYFVRKHGKAASLARENDIMAIVIKEIPMDTPKEMIIAAVSKFEKIKSIKIQLIGLWQKAVMEFTKLEQAVSLAAKWSFLIGKDSVRVAIAVGNHETWASRDQFRAFLFTLPVETTAHDLEDLLEGAGEKTCVINQSLETGNRVRYAVVCFDSDEVLESAFCTEPILGGVKLLWARLDLVCCEQCGKFGHSALECDAEVASAFKSSKFFIRPTNPNTCLQLAKLYVKKNVLISCPVVFGGKSWAQVVSVALVSHGFHAGSGSSSLPSSDLSSGRVFPPLPVVNSLLSAHLTLLKCSVELLSKQISNFLSRLDNISSAPLALSSQLAPSVVVPQSPISVPLVVANSDLDFDMAVDDSFVQFISLPSGVTGLLLGPSSSKVLTSEVGGLESKLVALDISVGSILAKLDQLCAGSGSSVISSSQ